MKKFFVYLASILSVGAVSACDLCATYVELGSKTSHELGVSLFEQYEKYDATHDEKAFESFSTILGFGYRFSDRWSAQLSIPYLDRELGDKTESGLGDITVFGIYRVLEKATEENVALIDVYAGLEMPTGDSDLLAAEKETMHGAEAHMHEYKHEHDHEHEHEHEHVEEEHSHADGHLLALGSGSWDGIFGARGLRRLGRWQGHVETQYALRSEGDFDFKYGDEFVVRGGIRYHIAWGHQHGVALGADIVREWSDDNEVSGEEQPDSGKTASYVGPAVDFTLGDHLTISAAYDVAIENENGGVHGAADERIRANLAWFF